ncbi:hypothetical protein OPV22_026985 [Ensete ventricosum]|uniref:VHS domain-containing protein n=1 Tax=Ensete ventricosum TaxID=4639 RepID=A0AAV8Q426_ENSVE|nr:hypothetical protein OPV22_026985 [Ensete ventricosum]
MVDGVTADEDKVAPVYKLEEVCELLRTSPASIVKEVSDYILKRLDHKSPIVKQKALRLIKYAVAKSGNEFRREMQRHSVAMRQLFHYKVAPTQGLDKRIQGFGNTNFEFQPEEKRSFLSEVVGLGSASIRQGLSTIAAAHSSRKNDTGSYKSPNLRRSLTTEIDSPNGYQGIEHHGESWEGSGISKKNSGTWGPDSRPSISTSVANEDTSSTNTRVKSREERLLETIVTSGGVRLQPTRDALQAFLAAAAKLDGVSMSHALEMKLQSHLWQVRMKAICVLESILKIKDDEHFFSIVSYFTENKDSVVRCTELPQASLREKAIKVLSLLGGEQEEEISDGKATSVPVVQMPDLIDTGEFDDYGSQDSMEKQGKQSTAELKPSNSLVDDLFASDPLADINTSGNKNQDDPFADVSFHVTEDKEGNDLFSGLTVDDKKSDIVLDVPEIKKPDLLDVFGAYSVQHQEEAGKDKGNIHDLMTGLSLNGIQENEPPGSVGASAAFSGLGLLASSTQPSQVPANGSMKSNQDFNSVYSQAPMQYGIPPNIMFNQGFVAQPMNYEAMSAFIAQQQFLLQNIGNLNSGFGQTAGNAMEGSYAAAPLPDIFQLSNNPVKSRASTTKSPKEETKAFDFISDHLASARAPPCCILSAVVALSSGELRGRKVAKGENPCLITYARLFALRSWTVSFCEINMVQLQKPWLTTIQRAVLVIAIAFSVLVFQTSMLSSRTALSSPFLAFSGPEAEGRSSLSNVSSYHSLRVGQLSLLSDPRNSTGTSPVANTVAPLSYNFGTNNLDVRTSEDDMSGDDEDDIDLGEDEEPESEFSFDLGNGVILKKVRDPNGGFIKFEKVVDPNYFPSTEKVGEPAPGYSFSSDGKHNAPLVSDQIKNFHNESVSSLAVSSPLVSHTTDTLVDLSTNTSDPISTVTTSIPSSEEQATKIVSSSIKQSTETLPKDSARLAGKSTSYNSFGGNYTPKRRKNKWRTMPPLSMSEMNSLLLKNRASYRAMRPRWSSAHDQNILAARAQIENAPNSKNDQELYEPAFRNLSMFKRSYELMESTLKVYIYKEGGRPIFHQPVLKGIYASEGWFMKLMKRSRHLTVKDPRDANMFYIPFSSRFLEFALYVPNSHNKKNLVQYLQGYMDMIAAKYPFWNRTGGADHFAAACHDWAPYETRHTMDSSIRALCNADLHEGFRVGKDVSLPETLVLSPKNPLRELGGSPASERSILAFFAGNMHGRLRPILLQHWENKDPDMKIFGPMPPGVNNKKTYIRYMKTSKYCICPRGYEVNSPRIVESIFYECVPVIISDNYVPPLFEVLNWEAFSVIIPEADVPRLKEILMSIPLNKYLLLQKGSFHHKSQMMDGDPPEHVVLTDG